MLVKFLHTDTHTKGRVRLLFKSLPIEVRTVLGKVLFMFIYVYNKFTFLVGQSHTMTCILQTQMLQSRTPVIQNSEFGKT